MFYKFLYKKVCFTNFFLYIYKKSKYFKYFSMCINIYKILLVLNS